MSGSAQPTALPVVLIPGWLDQAKRLDALAGHLRAAGRQVVTISPQPSDGSVPLETLAVQALAEIDARFGPKAAFDQVGFSMGGLIGRVILHWLGGRERIRRFVTISTPHRGVVSAGWAWQPALRQMQLCSPFLQSLNSHLDDLASRPFLSVWTPLDLTVLPATSAVLPVGVARRILSPAHGWMVYDPRVQRAVAQFLGRAPTCYDGQLSVPLSQTARSSTPSVRPLSW